MEGVAEDGAVEDHLAVGQPHVVLLDEDAVAVGGEVGGVELGDHLAGPRQAQELEVVDALGVDQDSGAVDDGHVLLVAQQDLVGSQIAVGAARLDLADGRGLDAELAVDALDVGAHAEGGHAVDVVGDAAEARALAGKEGLPPGGAAGARVLGGPVDEAGRVLVGAHEEDLGLLVQVDDGVLDAGAAGGQEQVEDGVDVLLERDGRLVLVLGVEEDDALAAALGDVLVLALLGVGQVVVLVENGARVDGPGLLVAALDDADAAAGDVAEAEVEAAELGAHHHEHAEERLRVLVRGQEAGVHAEADGHLGGGVEVGLEDVGVEGDELEHDLLLVLVGDGARDLGGELGGGQDAVHLQALVAERGQEGVLVAARLDVVGVGEGQVEGADEVGVLVDDLEDVVGGEGLLAEAALEHGEGLGVGAVAGVEQAGQGHVLGAEPVEEVAGEEADAVGVDGLLEAELAADEVVLEHVLGDAVQQADLLHDLLDGVVDGGVAGLELAVVVVVVVGGVAVVVVVDVFVVVGLLLLLLLLLLGGLAVAGHGAEVERHDGDAVGELLDVLARGGAAVVVVEVAEGREEAHGAALLEANDQTALLAVFDLEHADDGAGAALDDGGDDALVDDLGVGRHLLEEGLVGDDGQVGLPGCGVRVDKVALVDEVAAQAGRAGGERRGRAECFETVGAAFGARHVQVLFVDALLVLGALQD